MGTAPQTGDPGAGGQVVVMEEGLGSEETENAQTDEELGSALLLLRSGVN